MSKTWGNHTKVPVGGCFYADYDEEASQWAVFHTETDDVMYRCNGTEDDAEKRAVEYNDEGVR